MTVKLKIVLYVLYKFLKTGKCKTERNLRNFFKNNSDSSHWRSLSYDNRAYIAENKKVFKLKSMQKINLLDVFQSLNILGINLTKFSTKIENILITIVKQLFHFSPTLLKNEIF